jgi:hypothetical protein
MPPPDRRSRQIAIAIAAVVLLAWFLHWRTPAMQSERLFSRLKSAIENGRAGAVLELLHADYAMRACWPAQFAADGAGVEGLDDAGLRLLALRGLTVVFQLQASDPFVLGYRIDRVETLADDSVSAEVTLDLATRSGHHPLRFQPTLVHQRFILKRSGWWPTLTIAGHAPFVVALGGD